SSFELTKLQFSAISKAAGPNGPIVIQNEGPITATLDRGMVRITSLHLTGPQTDVQAGGTASVQAQTLNLTLNANTNLGVLQNFSQDVSASGDVVLAATVRGTTAKPLVNGRLDLRDASLNYTGLSNGISNANGVVLFNGNSASVQNLTADSGGGKVAVRG